MARSVIHPRLFGAIQPIAAGAHLSSVAVWRSPEPVDGRIGPPVEVQASLPITILATPADGALAAAVAGLGGGRAEHLGLAPADADIRVGDELRQGDRRFKVEGVGDWRVEIACALSELAG